MATERPILGRKVTSHPLNFVNGPVPIPVCSYKLALEIGDFSIAVQVVKFEVESQVQTVNCLRLSWTQLCKIDSGTICIDYARRIARRTAFASDYGAEQGAVSPVER